MWRESRSSNTRQFYTNDYRRDQGSGRSPLTPPAASHYRHHSPASYRTTGVPPQNRERPSWISSPPPSESASPMGLSSVTSRSRNPSHPFELSQATPDPTPSPYLIQPSRRQLQPAPFGTSVPTSEPSGYGLASSSRSFLQTPLKGSRGNVGATSPLSLATTSTSSVPLRPFTSPFGNGMRPTSAPTLSTPGSVTSPIGSSTPPTTAKEEEVVYVVMVENGREPREVVIRMGNVRDWRDLEDYFFATGLYRVSGFDEEYDSEEFRLGFVSLGETESGLVGLFRKDIPTTVPNTQFEEIARLGGVSNEGMAQVRGPIGLVYLRNQKSVVSGSVNETIRPHFESFNLGSYGRLVSIQKTATMVPNLSETAPLALPLPLPLSLSVSGSELETEEGATSSAIPAALFGGGFSTPGSSSGSSSNRSTPASPSAVAPMTAPSPSLMPLSRDNRDGLGFRLPDFTYPSSPSSIGSIETDSVTSTTTVSTTQSTTSSIPMGSGSGLGNWPGRVAPPIRQEEAVPELDLTDYEVDEEKVIDAILSKNLESLCVEERWESLFHMHFSNEKEILCRFVLAVLQESLRGGVYTRVGTAANLCMVNLGLRARDEEEMLFIVYDHEENEIERFSVWQEIEDDVLEHSARPPTFVFDRYSSLRALNLKHKKLSPQLQWETLQLLPLFQKHWDWFPSTFHMLTTSEVECIVQGYQNDLLKKVKNSSNAALPVVPLPEDESNAPVHYLLPLAFHDDPEFINLVVEIKEVGLYFVAVNLMTFDEAYLRVRLIRRLPSLHWLNQIVVRTFVLHGFVGQSAHLIQLVKKVMWDNRTPISVHSMEKDTFGLAREPLFDVVYYRRLNQSERGGSRSGRATGSGSGGGRSENGGSDPFVVIFRKVQKRWGSTETLEYNVPKLKLAQVRDNLLSFCGRGDSQFEIVLQSMSDMHLKEDWKRVQISWTRM